MRSCYKCHKSNSSFREDTSLKYFCSSQCQKEYYSIGGAIEGKKLPPLPAPKEHLLFSRIFQDLDHPVPVYGHILIRDIFARFATTPIHFEKLRQFDEFVVWGVQWIRKVLLDHFEKLKSSNDMISIREDNLPIIHHYMRPPHLSPELFTKLKPDVERMKQIAASKTRCYAKYRVSSEEMHDFLMEFIPKAIAINEYILYALDFFFMLDFPVRDTQDMEMLTTPLFNRITELRNIIVLSYKKPIDLDVFSPKDDEYHRRIPKGTYFYRGFKTYRGPLDANRNYAFFAFDIWVPFSYVVPSYKKGEDEERAGVGNTMQLKSYCETLGGIACFQVREDLKVLDLSHVRTVVHVLSILENNQAPPNVLKAFKTNWELSVDRTKFDRKSVDVTDRIVVTWLCQQGFNGYIAGGLGLFHGEAMICNPRENLDYLGFYEAKKEFLFPYCEAPYNETDDLFWEYF
jgi:hypothetical protein